VASPEIPEGQIKFHGGVGVTHQTEQKSVSMRPFLAKLSKKEIY
jgi:hypothetical protein